MYEEHTELQQLHLQRATAQTALANIASPEQALLLAYHGFNMNPDASISICKLCVLQIELAAADNTLARCC